MLLSTFIVLYLVLQTSPSTSQDLISGAEQVTKLLGQTLTNDTTEAMKIRPNIGNTNKPNVLVIFLYTFVHSYQS